MTLMDHARGGGASPFHRRVGAQALIETLLLVRRGENLLFTVILPVLFLVLATRLDIVPGPPSERVRAVMPLILTMALMSSALVGLAISTGFERKYLVLKRLGVSPLGRGGLMVAKIVSIVGVQVLQVAVLVTIAVAALGWTFDGNALAVLGSMALGTLAFGAMALTMAGTLRAEGTLALANAVYVILLLFGGVAVPLAKLPVVVSTFAAYLPSAALADGLTGALVDGVWVGRALVVLAVWAVVMSIVAVRTFKWEVSDDGEGSTVTRRTILGVFAHPDDESMGPGAALAKYAALGHRVVFVTATDGGAGRLHEERPDDSAELRRRRRDETLAAAAILGVEFGGFLGWEDGRLREMDPLVVEERLGACHPRGPARRGDHVPRIWYLVSPRSSHHDAGHDGGRFTVPARHRGT